MQRLAATVANPYVFTSDAEDATRPASKNDRLRLAAIGMRYQGSVITEKALPNMATWWRSATSTGRSAEKARAQFGGKAEIYEDYRQLLERNDIDAVLIGTPDHWHAAMLIDACRAGKDVYCEKPLTLTIDEGQRIAEVVRETGRIVQVGSWQRSDRRYRLAVEMVRQGRIGKVQTRAGRAGQESRPADRSPSRRRRPTSTGTSGKVRLPTCRTLRSARTTRFAGGTNTPAAR